MITYGDINDKTLVSLIETIPYGFTEPAYHIEQLCPVNRYPISDDRAPWNQEGNDPDPSTYLNEDGEPTLWTPPVLVPIVKLPQPNYDQSTQKVEPILVWFEDRVERDWTIINLTEPEIALQQRKVWPTAARYLQEFTFSEMAAISLSADPTIAALRFLLASWDGEIWSDDPRVVAGLNAIELAQIIDSSRRAEILSKL